MESLLVTLEGEWLGFVAYSPRVLGAVTVLLVSWLAGKSLAKVILLALRRTNLNQLHQTFFQFVAIYLVVFFGLVVALNILNMQKIAISMMAGGGLTAVVLGFAFREIGENFLAGLFLAFSRPFNPGDVIKTEETEGEVKAVELRYTHIRAEDGRDVYVPSSQLFNKSLTNFTKDGLRRVSFSLGIDYTNDALAATGLLAEATRGVRGVLDSPVCNAYILSLAPQYVEIMVFFWVDTFNKSIPILGIRNKVMDACRMVLLTNDFIVSSATTTNIAIVNNSRSPGTD